MKWGLGFYHQSIFDVSKYGGGKANEDLSYGSEKRL